MAHASNFQEECVNPSAFYRRDLSYSATFDSMDVKSALAANLESQIAHLRNCLCHVDKGSCPVAAEDHEFLGRIILFQQEGICKQTGFGRQPNIVTKQQSVDSSRISTPNQPSFTG